MIKINDFVIKIERELNIILYKTIINQLSLDIKNKFNI